jgi:hypothetical protein
VSVWVLWNRFGNKYVDPGAPLKMPTGTIRALCALMIVPFPLTFMIDGEPIPAGITGLIFVVVAFYFEARSDKNKFRDLVNQVKHEKEEKEKVWYPLYLPKYSVRIIIFLTMIVEIIVNSLGPNLDLEKSNTILNLVIIIIYFWIGLIFGKIREGFLKGKIRRHLAGVSDEKTEEKIIKEMETEKKVVRRAFESVLSIIVLSAVIFSLILYEREMD